MIYLSHSLSIASYESVRVAINYDSTNTEVVDKCNEMINARSVVDGQVVVSSSNVSTVGAAPQSRLPYRPHATPTP